jgi:UDP-N-acetylmuramate dehydrogenase
MLTPLDLLHLQVVFGDRVHQDVPLARFTAARLGGHAEVFLEVGAAEELAKAARLAWQIGCPFTLLGGGSNVLVSDRGVRGLVVLNRARHARFNEHSDPPKVWAESGVNFGMLARQCAQRGLAGLEWAAGIPGTLGGAVVGNAGAHGKDMAGNLLLAEILHQSNGMQNDAVVNLETQRESWPVERLEYAYRHSALKRELGQHVVLAALLRLEHSQPQAVQAQMDEFGAYRKRTQPPGASMGSIFKNPPGDYAGRLIEAAGLKGAQVGGALISPVHANFFINQGHATAADLYALIRLAQQTVAEKFDVHLELEIQLLGEW